jgi:hypothetical protein
MAEGKKPGLESIPIEFTVSDSDDDGYQVDKAYLRCKDDHGVRYQRVPIPAKLIATCAEIVAAQPKIGWRTVNDVIRDALHHRLHWWAEHEGDTHVSEVMQMERAIIQAEENEATNAAAKRYVESIKRQLNEAHETGHHEDLLRLLGFVDQQLEAMRPYWAKQLKKAVEPFQHRRLHSATGE